MAFLLNKSALSALRLDPKRADNSSMLPRRGFHVEPGAREKALLEEHPSLRLFKSPKKGVRIIKRVGDVLTIVVVAGCCYQIYMKAALRKESRAKESV